MKILLGADQYPEYINRAATFTAPLAASTGLPRAEVISCGIDLSRYADLGTPGDPQVGPTFLFVGRLESLPTR